MLASDAGVRGPRHLVAVHGGLWLQEPAAHGTLRQGMPNSGCRRFLPAARCCSTRPFLLGCSRGASCSLQQCFSGQAEGSSCASRVRVCGVGGAPSAGWSGIHSLSPARRVAQLKGRGSPAHKGRGNGAGIPAQAEGRTGARSSAQAAGPSCSGTGDPSYSGTGVRIPAQAEGPSCKWYGGALTCSGS